MARLDGRTNAVANGMPKYSTNNTMFMAFQRSRRCVIVTFESRQLTILDDYDCRYHLAQAAGFATIESTLL
jgi:hypothetical protein